MTIFAPPAHGGAGYQIDKSLRFRSSASAYLSRTPASAGNRQTWTWSGWVKRGILSAVVGLLEGNAGATDLTAIRIQADNTIGVQDYSIAGGYNLTWNTSALLRDPTAHCHIVVAYDTTQASSVNAVKLYYNGIQLPLTFTAVAGTYLQNRNSYVNATNAQRIGVYNGLANYLDGYLSEINFIDGQALTPSSFGETNSDGVWVPKKYTGTYGTNGFYLDFKDGTSLTTLGQDKSGNSNNWTLTNHSLTAGYNYDWMVDTPTNNYCTLNSAVNQQQFGIGQTPTNTGGTIVDANLRSIGQTSYWNAWTGTQQLTPSSKIYWEVWAGNHTSNYGNAGIVNESGTTQYSPSPASYTTGDLLGFEFDGPAGTFKWNKNGVYQAQLASGLTGNWLPKVQLANGCYYHNNFGQAPLHTSATYDAASGGYFRYTPPTGFKALCTANLPVVAITNPKKHFDVLLYSGNTGVTVNVTGAQFQPDKVWIKNRSLGASGDHVQHDVLRGNFSLSSNLTLAEIDQSANWNGFTTNGFSVKGSAAQYNNTGNVYASWLWKANGAGVSNTAGTITSTVSANTTAGFSIVTYTGTGANATVGHGLGVAPKLVIVKARGTPNGTARDWYVWHSNFTGLEYIWLNLTSTKQSLSTIWNSTTPTTTVFSLGSEASVNYTSSTYVAYCYAEIPGYSKFGSYTGNGSTDGPFVYCGFRPRYVLIKRAVGGVGNWAVVDTARNTYNITNLGLRANTSDAEVTGTTTADPYLDVTATGFKLRGTSSDINNSSSDTYIFAAFAEHPFGGSNVSPSPAR